MVRDTVHDMSASIGREAPPKMLSEAVSGKVLMAIHRPVILLANAAAAGIQYPLEAL
jgi:hypothetical protein